MVLNKAVKAVPPAENNQLPDYWVSGLDQSQIGQDGKPVERWVRMGAAWNKKDGKGILIRVNSTPLSWNGAMLLQAPRDAQAE